MSIFYGVGLALALALSPWAYANPRDRNENKKFIVSEWIRVRNKSKG